MFPTHKRADYAQFKLGMAHFYQMRDPMRDQTETIEAIRELTTFVERYPTVERSALHPEAQKRLREARDRIGRHQSSGLAFSITARGGIRAPSSGSRDCSTRIPSSPTAMPRCSTWGQQRLGRRSAALPPAHQGIRSSEFLERAQRRASEIKESMEKKTSGGNAHDS